MRLSRRYKATYSVDYGTLYNEILEQDNIKEGKEGKSLSEISGLMEEKGQETVIEIGSGENEYECRESEAIRNEEVEGKKDKHISGTELNRLLKKSKERSQGIIKRRKKKQLFTRRRRERLKAGKFILIDVV